MDKKLKVILFSETFVKYGIKKVDIYSKYFNKKYFDLFLVFNNNENFEIKKVAINSYLVPRNKLENFVKKNSIDIFCSFSANISEDIILDLTKKCIYFNSVNFTPLYKKDKSVTNLIISKTDYLKIKDLQENKKLDNAYVVYNPFDRDKWIQNSKYKENYLNYFKGKNIKFIVGRIARAEPSKWNFLIIATLFKLNLKRNFNYGFIFVGMPKLYILTLKLVLSKKFKENILFEKQLSGYKNLSKFYNSINLFWQTSYIGESFGNVIVESFCFKVPVITDFKDFYKNNGLVNSKWYNAQMELVDINKNGYYANYPSIVIDFFESMNKNKLLKYGENGFEKVKNTYDIKISIKTMGKLFYEKAYKKNLILKIPIFYSNFNYYPSINEVKNFKIDYLKKLKIAYETNKVLKFEFLIYKSLEKIWNFIEKIYLVTRKVLREYLKIDIER